MTKSDLSLYGTGGQMFHSQVDANFQRLLYYSGVWAPGSYEANELVTRDTIAWVCINDTTEEPVVGAVDWEAISRSPSALCEFHQDPTPTAGADVGISFVSIDWMDLQAYTPLNIIADPVDNFVTFEQEGVYQLQFYMVLEHNEAQSGRLSNVRILNATDGIPGDAIPFFVGRNQEGSNVSVSVQVNVQAADLGKQWRMQWGGGDAFSDIIYRQTRWSLNRIA